MGLLNECSLGATLDAVNDALFFGGRVRPREVRAVATWLASRQGLPGSYAEMFAPTQRDYSDGIRLFTGERITSGAAVGHILGEESCRALLLLGFKAAAVRSALARATRSMDERLSRSEAEQERRGFF